MKYAIAFDHQCKVGDDPEKRSAYTGLHRWTRFLKYVNKAGPCWFGGIDTAKKFDDLVAAEAVLAEVSVDWQTASRFLGHCELPRIVEVDGYLEKNHAQVRYPLPAPFKDVLEKK